VVRSRFTALGPGAARRTVLAVGSVFLLAVAAIMWVRGVDPVEVGGTLLFLPVFVGLVLGQLRGGLALGAFAAAAYFALRYPAIQAVGVDRFDGLLATRGLAYLAFGGVGGWAFGELERSLNKLEVYDQIDDASGLHNARFFVQETGLEVARSKRYQTVFSVVQAEVPAAPLDELPRRRRQAVLREVGAQLTEAARNVDRVVHARDDGRHRLVLVLPETGKEGAQIVAERMTHGIVAILSQRGVEMDPSHIKRQVVTYPGDDEALEDLRREFEAIDREEHPQSVSDN
jgi:GGDEF domain-containing protein